MKQRKFMIDYNLAHDLNEPGYYIVDMKAEAFQDVIAKFLDEEDAVDYCEVMNGQA